MFTQEMRDAWWTLNNLCIIKDSVRCSCSAHLSISLLLFFFQNMSNINFYKLCNQYIQGGLQSRLSYLSLSLSIDIDWHSLVWTKCMYKFPPFLLQECHVWYNVLCHGWCNIQCHVWCYVWFHFWCHDQWHTQIKPDVSCSATNKHDTWGGVCV